MQNQSSPEGENGHICRQAWTAPALQVRSISQITQLGFASNCDGGLGLPAIDGDVIFCRRRR